MPGKHKTVLPLRRYSFIAGAATLLVVLVSWVAVRSVGPAAAEPQVPLMVQPAVPLPTSVAPVVESVLPVAPSPSPSASRSPSPSPTSASPTVTATATVTPTKTKAVPKPTEKATTKPAPARATFTARYVTSASWDRGFIAGLEVINTGKATGAWSVTVTYDARAGVRAGGAWNADLSGSADTVTLTGGQLAPGARASAGFQASKQVRGRIQPSACTVGGSSCSMG